MDGDYNRLVSGLRTLGERIDKLERIAVGSEIVLIKLDHVGQNVESIKTVVERIDGRVARNTEAIQQHNTRVTVLERFCNDQVKPALTQIMDNRVQIAVMLAKYAAVGAGGAAGIGGVIYLIGKGVGAW